MGQVRHGSARTAAAVRRAGQHRPESLQSLATRYRITPKTVAKWRKRLGVRDARRGPEPVLTVLTAEQEAVVGAPRRSWTIASARCKPRCRTSPAWRCPAVFNATAPAAARGRAAPPKKKFKDHPLSCLHSDFAEARIEEGRQCRPNA